MCHLREMQNESKLSQLKESKAIGVGCHLRDLFSQFFKYSKSIRALHLCRKQSFFSWNMPTRRDAQDPVRALLNAQALHIMRFRLQDFSPRGGLDRKVLGLLREAPETAPKAPVQKILKISQNFYQINVPKKHQNCISRPFRTDTFFVSGRSKNLKFPPGGSRLTFQRPDAQFCAKRPHVKNKLASPIYFN